MDRQTAFERAVLATKQKDFQTARQITTELLKQNKNDIDSLLLYSLVAESKAYSVAALKRILEINPNHKIARQKLASLSPMSPKPTPVSKPPSLPQAPPNQSATQKKPPHPDKRQKKKKKNG